MKSRSIQRAIALAFAVVVASTVLTGASAPPLTAGVPTISGAAVVGETLTVHPGDWSPTPDSLSYRWLRNG